MSYRGDLYETPMHIREGHAGPWVRWFAWHPVRLNDAVSVAWLRVVERRRFYAAPWFCIPSWLEYRSVSPVGKGAAPAADPKS